MFTLQIQCPTIEDAERIIAALKYGANPAVVESLAAQIPATSANQADRRESEQSASQEPKKRGRPRREVAEKPAASNDAASSSTASDPAEGQSGATAQQAPTLDDARAALKAVQAKYGTDDMSKPLEVLGQFSAGRISEVKPEQYPAFIAACKAA